MIKNFSDYLNEEFRNHRVWGISGYKIKEYEDDDSIEFQRDHPQFSGSLVTWFTIDKNSQFHTITRDTEEFVLDKMMEILNPPVESKMKSLFNAGKQNTEEYTVLARRMRSAEENKRMFLEFVEDHPSFKKWLERGKRSIKFGL